MFTFFLWLYIYIFKQCILRCPSIAAALIFCFVFLYWGISQSFSVIISIMPQMSNLNCMKKNPLTKIELFFWMVIFFQLCCNKSLLNLSINILNYSMTIVFYSVYLLLSSPVLSFPALSLLSSLVFICLFLACTCCYTCTLYCSKKKKIHTDPKLLTNSVYTSVDIWWISWTTNNTLTLHVLLSLLRLSWEPQDGGISGLNLDYFGPVDECSSDSETDTPLPGQNRKG